MRLDIWVSLAVVLSAVFFTLGYAFNVGRAEETSSKFAFIDFLYFVGSLFFFAYASLNLYQAIKYPRADHQGITEQLRSVKEMTFGF